MTGFEDRTNKIGEKSLILQNIKFDKLKGKEGDIYYGVFIYWDAYFQNKSTENVTYKVYRSIDGVNYENIVSDGNLNLFFFEEYFEGEEYIICGLIDPNVDPESGNSYSYYITACGSDWETNPSQIVSIDTWLPSCRSLNSPQDGLEITEANPIFTWDSVGASSFPYGSICSGESDLWIWDTTEFAQAWYIIFNDLTTSTATYNQDGQATPLVSGHSYCWNLEAYGYDENDHLIALSYCEFWHFDYLEN